MKNKRKLIDEEVMHLYKNLIPFLVRLGVILLTVLLIYSFLLIKPIWKPILIVIMWVMIPFIISAFLALLLHPFMKKIQQWGLPKIWSILILYVLFFGLGGILLYKGFPTFSQQFNDFSINILAIVSQYKEWIHQLQVNTSHWPIEAQSQLDLRIEHFEKWLEKMLNKSIQLVIHSVNFILVILLIPFITFYYLKDLEHIKKAFWYITPSKWRKEGKQFIIAAYYSLGDYIRGQIYICIIVGVVTSTAFALIGLDYPVVLGVVIAITNIIPYFGSIIGLLPVVSIGLLSSVKLTIIAIIIVFVVQFIEGNILSPYIIGKSLDIHPLLIIAVLIIGEQLAGIIGMIIAVPILVIMKIGFVQFRNYLVETRSA